MPGGGGGGAMLKLRFDWYITGSYTEDELKFRPQIGGRIFERLGI